MSVKGGRGSKSPEREASRDAGTGKFVTERYAESHPRTTVTEKVPGKPGGSPPVLKEAKSHTKR